MSEPATTGSAMPEPVLTTIGDISITQHWLYTPNGAYPLRGSVWSIADMSQRQERMAPIGIILAILFIWMCFLSLFFLLMKEVVVSGHYQITVQGNGFHHTTLIPANQTNVETLQQMVNYARSVAAVA